MAKAIASSFIGLLFITLNLLFFTMVASTYIPCPPKTQHKNHPPSISKGGYHKCQKDTLKLKVCGNLLNDLVHVVVGSPLLSSKSSCCSLIENLADVDAAVCLCTAIKAHVLGTHINAALSLTLLLNNCGKTAPRGFKCA